MNSSFAKNTIISQFVMGISCLVVGAGVIYLWVLYWNSWDVYYSDGSQHNFSLEGVLGFIILLVSVTAVTAEQFEDTVLPTGVFHLGTEYVLWGSIMPGFMMIIMILVGGTFKLIVVEIVFLVMLYAFIWALTGFAQFSRLKWENFDPAKHKWLLSNEANLQACRLGILTYREYVKTFWETFFLFAILIGFTGFWLAAWDAADGLIFIFNVFFVSVLVFLIFYRLPLFVNPQILYIESDDITKSHKPYMTRYSPEIFRLHINDQNFTTNSWVWEHIYPKVKYRLWFSAVHNYALAVERLDEGISKSLQPTPSSNLGIRFLKTKTKSITTGLLGLGATILAVILWNKHKSE